MARSIYNIDFNTIMDNTAVFGIDGDTTFPFQIIAVHNTVDNFFIAAKYITLTKEGIYQSRLSCIDVGNDRDIYNLFFSFIFNSTF